MYWSSVDWLLIYRYLIKSNKFFKIWVATYFLIALHCCLYAHQRWENSKLVAHMLENSCIENSRGQESSPPIPAFLEVLFLFNLLTCPIDFPVIITCSIPLTPFQLCAQLLHVMILRPTNTTSCLSSPPSSFRNFESNSWIDDRGPQFEFARFEHPWCQFHNFLRDASAMKISNNSRGVSLLP